MRSATIRLKRRTCSMSGCAMMSDLGQISGRADAVAQVLSALREVAPKLLLEEGRRRFEPTQMGGLHEHDRRLDADAGARDTLQPPALRMRGKKSRRDEPEADPARHERHLHVDIVDRGGDLERRAELAQLRLSAARMKQPGGLSTHRPSSAQSFDLPLAFGRDWGPFALSKTRRSAANTLLAKSPGIASSVERNANATSSSPARVLSMSCCRTSVL